MAAPNVPNVPIAPLVPQLQAQPPQAQPAQAQPAPIVSTTRNVFDVFSSTDMYILYGRKVGDSQSKITHPQLSQSTPQATKDIYANAVKLISELKKKPSAGQFANSEMEIVTHIGYNGIQNELKKTGLVINFFINSTPFPDHADEIGFHFTFHSPNFDNITQTYVNTPGQLHLKFNGSHGYIPILLKVKYVPGTPIGPANMIELDFVNIGDINTYCQDYIKNTPYVQKRLHTHWVKLNNKATYTNDFSKFKRDMILYYRECFIRALYVINGIFLDAFKKTILRPTADIESALGITGAQGAPIPRTLSVFDPFPDPQTGFLTEYKKSGMHKYLKYKTKYLELKKMLDDLNINN